VVDANFAGGARTAKRLSIELLLEDGFDGAIGARADLERVQRGGVDTGSAIRAPAA
jgi:hypothetical protein